ncbi:MAG: UDP-3-O-acyl-N-acetylglucosamine deacetylase [Burkholderiales bacterium]|jgi:UDP-3-O-[3-hydroxymyristoyl] N-acetylglucosamine deacetylase|nr:UDP-3-O-acyl-N-acetylglucosamine deacetylase [Betaproteobacteria bacterium]
MIRQRTVKNKVRATGVGVHLGHRVEMIIRPAPPNTGIVFRRTDMTGAPTVRAHALNVNDTRMSTRIEDTKTGAHVATVEHLMSAFAGLGIDNVYVDLNAVEVPIMDGSAAPFVFLMQAAGIEEQAPAKKYIRVKKVVELKDRDKLVRLEPHNGFKLKFSIAFDHPVFQGRQNEVEVDFAETPFVKDVARARTFGFTHEVEAMRQAGLGRGGSLDNVIVIDDFHVLNPDGLRSADEFVKHKALDAVGDLYMLGHPLIGAFTGVKSGHAMNNQLVRALLADETAFEMLTFDCRDELPSAFGVMALSPALETA